MSMYAKAPLGSQLNVSRSFATTCLKKISQRRHPAIACGFAWFHGV